MMKMKINSKFFIVSIIIMIAVSFAGCISIGNDDKTIVYVGCQNLPDCLPVAISLGYLEEEMGVEIEIVTFDAGRDMLNALASGSIQFADLGNVPATVGLVNGVDAEIIWINRVLGSSEALVAKDNANIVTIKDLKGKTVATTFTSTAHYSLLQGLKINGISENDLTIIDMSPAAIYAAWVRGDIDAAYTWNPTLSEILLLDDSQIIVDSGMLAEKGVITADITLVRSDFAKNNPELVIAYVKAMNLAVNLYNNANEEAVLACAEYIGTDKETAASSMNGGIWLSSEEQLSGKYLGTSSSKGALADTLKTTADYLYSVKSTTSSPDISVFRDIVNPSYIEQL